MVLVGSDGLFDNLFISDIAQVVAAQPSASSQELATQLKDIAMNVAKDKRAESPFAQRAKAAGYFYEGGKPDDVSVVVARVMQRV